MKKVLMVGEALSRPTQTEPLNGLASRWMSKVACIDHTVLLSRTLRINLMNEPTARWPAHLAREAARKIFNENTLVPNQWKAIILLGRRVQAACAPKLITLPPEVQVTCGLAGYFQSMPVYFVPHPSGQNRWWNDPHNRLVAGLILRHVIS